MGTLLVPYDPVARPGLRSPSLLLEIRLLHPLCDNVKNILGVAQPPEEQCVKDIKRDNLCPVNLLF